MADTSTFHALASDPRLAKLSPAPSFTRLALAAGCCGLAGSISVAALGLALIYVGSLFGMGVTDPVNGFYAGLETAVVLAALNWVFFFVTAPAAAAAIGLALGRMPTRGVVRASPYVRAGGWALAALVGGAAGVIAFLGEPAAAPGALAAGAMICAVAGRLCGWLFWAIVQPETAAP